jgi:hypothetical protein
MWDTLFAGTRNCSPPAPEHFSSTLGQVSILDLRTYAKSVEVRRIYAFH